MRLIIFVASLIAATCSAAPTPALNPRAAADYSAANLGDAVVVMQRGQIIFEEYQRGFDGSNAHLLASGTKSFNCALAVAAQFIEQKLKP